MHAYRRQLLLKGLELFDLCVIAGALFLGVVAYSQRMSFNLAEVLAMRLKVSNFALIVAMLGLCHLVLRAQGLYESRRLSTRSAEVGDILKAVMLCTLGLGATALLLKLEVGTRSFIATFFVASSVGLIVSRLIFRHLLAQLRRKGHNLRQVLIIGTNPRATHLAVRIGRKPELGYRVLGFADDPWPGLRGFKELGYPISTDLSHLSQFLRESVVDEVFICLPLKSYYETIRDIIERCESQGILVRLLGRLFDLRMAHAMSAENLGDETVVSIYNAGQLDGWPFLLKRLFDVVIATALVVFLLPVFILTALAIRVTSTGPVFFLQERVGINKRRFRVFKFRTMVIDAEKRQGTLETLNEATGPVFKIRNDPRITPIGKFLRKTSIDELPQLLNVIAGDMSLVGPRPLPVRDYNGFSQDWHRRRFSVRPGITCLWQVNGRSRLPFERWMELDMEYIDKWSLWLDLKILVKTVPAVLRGSGAA
jgi:exopolysaccharide biosynthesis polyprenyl glycosylphosphotransferase